jgi:hypothetical protein
LLSLVAQEDLEVHQLDVKTAFLNGDLTEEIYMKCPPGFEVPGTVWRLQKALYGLLQAAQAWYSNLKSSLLGAGFYVSTADPCLYLMQFRGEFVCMLVHVDDCLVVGNAAGVSHAKVIIEIFFEVKDLGAVSVFVGLDVIRDRSARKLLLLQRRYVQSMLE